MAAIGTYDRVVPRSGGDSRLEMTRELGAILARDVDGLTPAALNHILAHVRGLDVGDEAREVVVAAVRANIAAFADVLRHDVRPEESEAPLMALVHVRRLARSGVGLDSILRLYRLGEEWLFERIHRLAQERLGDRPDLPALLEQVGLTLLRFVDVVSVRIAAEFESERETMVRGTLARREGIVRAVLGGEEVELDAAERILGYRLQGSHLALLCWERDRAAEQTTAVHLEEAVRALAGAFGVARPLVLSDGPALIAGWLPVPADITIDRRQLEDVIRESAPAARAAFGAVRPGIGGFRETRREADRARAVALASAHQPICVLYQEIALIGLLASDLEAARRFVADQLGKLGVDDASHATLRGTVLEVFQAAGSHKVAAHALGVHRNTIALRLARAEEILGHALDKHRRELEAALLLAHWLGRRVLPAAREI